MVFSIIVVSVVWEWEGNITDTSSLTLSTVIINNKEFHCIAVVLQYLRMVLRKEINRGDIIFDSVPFAHVLIKDKRYEN